MKRLFRISTNRFTLDWDRVRNDDPSVLPGIAPVPGRLKITILEPTLQLLSESYKDGLPFAFPNMLDEISGPPLHEQTEYSLYLQAFNNGSNIEIRHRYPPILQALSKRANGQIVHGSVNFRGQIGRSIFSIYLDGIHQLDFEVEVFPTKIDYESDYEEIVAEIQSILTSLAYEYLRSTYQLGKIGSAKRASKLEWLVLLEHLVEGLEKALNQIAQHPSRGLMRREKPARLEKIRRVDSRVRSQLRRGHGKGMTKQIGSIFAREQINHRPAELTLDTPEHRWLRMQLFDIQRKLSQIVSLHLKEKSLTNRAKQIIDGINQLKSRISRLIRLEPIEAADGSPPVGFASLQLISAPGYGEAYRLLIFLKMGLRLEGDFINLSVKDLELLYEYWTYLTVVRILYEKYGAPYYCDQLFKINQTGLSVQLKKGTKQTVSFELQKDRRVSVDYNPEFRNREKTLIPQKPDILIRLEQDNWPTIQLVCDAKYRIDATEEYKRQFGSFGPPSSSINVLHRYRDAILELDDNHFGSSPLKRSIVQGVALFPMNKIPDQNFRDSRLWLAIEKIGVGAIPAVPSNIELLKEWLVGALRQGGWSMADRAIANYVTERAYEWKAAAGKPVLIGLLRSPKSKEHLDWIRAERTYYCPESKTQRRQYAVSQVAIYVPAGIGEPSGIQYVADVEHIEVLDRSRIDTPWLSSRNKRMVVYRLKELQRLKKPVKFDRKKGSTIRQNRWTTRLGLQRAGSIDEIALETELEWRFLEWIKVNNLTYRIESKMRENLSDPENPKGRAWIHLGENGGVFVRYDGKNGFLVKAGTNEEEYKTLNDLPLYLLDCLSNNGM